MPGRVPCPDAVTDQGPTVRTVRLAAGTGQGREHDVLDRLWQPIRRWEEQTRPTDAGFAAAMARRWAELPEVVKTPGQVLGRFTAWAARARTGCSRRAT